MAALTGLALSAAAGLNAYIPFLAVALVARFTTVTVLPAGFEWMTSWWAIGIGAALLVTDVVLDKIPAVDSLNDAVATVLRPATGGLVFAASTAAARLDDSSWMRAHPWVPVVAGIVVAAIVHTLKATARPVINAGTLGAGGPVVSTVEDVGSAGLSVLALLAPVLALVALLLVAGGAWWGWRRYRRSRSKAAGRGQPAT